MSVKERRENIRRRDKGLYRRLGPLREALTLDLRIGSVVLQPAEAVRVIKQLLL
jgi:hypothetical protein